MLLPLLLLVACSKLLPPKDRVIALEGATLIDGTGGAPKPDARAGNWPFRLCPHSRRSK